MNPGGESSIPPGPRDRERYLRARSLPSRRPYDKALILSMLHYLCLILTLTGLVCFVHTPSPPAASVVVFGASASVGSWFVSFFVRRTTFCPLCKGTPLINSRALTHSKARRLPPFNHGTTAILSILATQKFRCMYCGSDYDLLKRSSRLSGGPDGQEQ